MFTLILFWIVSAYNVDHHGLFIFTFILDIYLINILNEPLIGKDDE